MNSNSGCVKNSPSSGVCGCLDEVWDVLEELDGPGVESGESDIGGGVMEMERGMMMLILGRPICKVGSLSVGGRKVNADSFIEE